MIARNAGAASMGDVLINASRQVWLAGLGAAVVTRDWAGKEAGTLFRNLVREGTAIESRAMRVVGDRLETSFVQANSAWNRARSGVTGAILAYADTAATLVRDTLGSNAGRAVAPRKSSATRKAAPHKAATAKTRRTKRAPKTKRA